VVGACGGESPGVWCFAGNWHCERGPRPLASSTFVHFIAITNMHVYARATSQQWACHGVLPEPSTQHGLLLVSAQARNSVLTVAKAAYTALPLTICAAGDGSPGTCWRCVCQCQAEHQRHHQRIGLHTPCVYYAIRAMMRYASSHTCSTQSAAARLRSWPCASHGDRQGHAHVRFNLPRSPAWLCIVFRHV
jgi:hypothetical protein